MKHPSHGATQAQVTLDISGRMLLGTDVASAMTTLEALPVDVIGLNCSTGPEHMREPIRYLTQNAAHPVSCIPNAGLPLNTGTGEAIYPLEPEPMAAMLAEFARDLGVRIVGGCCGTTPQHISAMRKALDSSAHSSAVIQISDVFETSEISDVEPPTQFAQKLSRGDFAISVEMDPPRGLWWRD